MLNYPFLIKLWHPTKYEGCVTSNERRLVDECMADNLWITFAIFCALLEFRVIKIVGVVCFQFPLFASTLYTRKSSEQNNIPNMYIVTM